MDKNLFDRIVQQLLPEMDDPAARKALVESALYGTPVLEKVQWDGAARPFTVRLVRQLESFGQIAPDRPALVALLEDVRGQVGEDRQAQIDTLINDLKAPPSEQTITLPENQVDDDLYVFLSYARPDQATAEKVEAFLKAAGVRVFRDTSDIREGGNWDMTIEQALQACHRMVLLLSAASMPYRKEVHREWFFFDQKRKPIYPLYVADCELHSRMYAYNFIDVRHDLQGGLERLLADLQRDFALPDPAKGADKVGVFDDAEVEERTLPEALQALLDAVRNPEGDVVLSVEQAQAIKDHKPTDLTTYRLGRIAEWSLPRYRLDDRFVNLTLLLDKGEDAQQRWQHAEDYRFNDLRDVMSALPDDPVLVVLGAPGSGKSTLLRRLQLDHSLDRLRDDGDEVSFFVGLNGYRPRADGTLPEPREWLAGLWADRYPDLPPLEDELRAGRVLLLLDAINEIPHKDTAQYRERGYLWRSFAQEAAYMGNRIVFSCRSLDYSGFLSSPEMRVPQVEVQPMSAEQVWAFLGAYVPAHAETVWHELEGSAQFDLFRTPYFLKLLCEQVAVVQHVPQGRAGLFTGFVRQALGREANRPLFQPDTLLSERDHHKLARGKWRHTFDLPARGVLIPALSHLAFTMQQDGLGTESKQVRVDYDDACDLIDKLRDDAAGKAETVIKAGVALNVLDEDDTNDEVTFFHQLLQEFFAARKLAAEPDPALVHVAWHVDQVSPTLAETLATLAEGDPLPGLPQTGWEETTLTAAPMTDDPNRFIRDLVPHNLPLAARCAASPEVSVQPDLKREIQDALIERAQDYENADLRARIAAGLALGALGDPRFERRTGPHGDYLLPPMVDVEGGTYPIGDDGSGYDDEKPAHTVELAAFQIGQFPVTNAEYEMFIQAGGYADERWWDTDAALAWLHGESSTEGQKQQWRDNWQTLRSWPDGHIQNLVKQGRITSEQAEQWEYVRSLDKETLETELEEAFPEGTIYRQPEFWDDSRFNNPNQPVVGVTWFEARAYCNWLSATTGVTYDLPSEVQFEAAARGQAGRTYPYGPEFDVARSNTFERHVRRTTPVGVFDNATPEGAFDLSGNAYTWTRSVYDQERFPYPYRADDGREDPASSARRVLRGGSWLVTHDNARAVCRFDRNPNLRVDGLGFRVCRPPSL